jgi:hypothetical protein
MIDNRSLLMKRLAEIMPKKPEPPQDEKLMMRIEMHPIRQSAESFTHWLDDQLPANKEEMTALLCVFGEILNGEMERMLNVSNRLREDLLATLPIAPTMIHLSEIGEVTADAVVITAKRSCNRHDDCDQAAKDWLLNHHMEKYVPVNFHCHNDECEECFGN